MYSNREHLYAYKDYVTSVSRPLTYRSVLFSYSRSALTFDTCRVENIDVIVGVICVQNTLNVLRVRCTRILLLLNSFALRKNIKCYLYPR